MVRVEYNPHPPQLLGNEWTPIQQADLRTPATIEQGYQFRVGTVPVTPALATFSPAETRYAPNTAQMVYVYPTGGPPPTDASSGPVVTTLIAPATSATTTGTITLVNAASVAAALAAPLDGSYVNFAEGVANLTLDLDVFFTIPATLLGRRILSLDIEYAAISTDPAQNTGTNQFTGVCLLRPNSTAYVVWAAQGFPTGGPTVLTGLLGETNSFWRPNTVAGNPDNPEIMPWTYDQLLRFAVGTAVDVRQAIRFVVRASALRDKVVQLHYLALKVTHCAERRAYFGGWRVQNAADGYVAGSRSLQVRDLSLGAGTPIAATANYTIMTTNVYSPPAVPITQFGAALMRPSNPPLIRALRQLERVPGIAPAPDVVAGTLFNRPTQPGNQFIRSDTMVIPQLTLHTSSAIITGVHPYGVQVAAPIQATGPTQSAVQGVLTAGKAPVAGGSYNHITFYARLVDDVGADPSNLLQVVINIGGSDVASATISIADFKALPEIADGWRKVQLLIGPVTIFDVSVVTVRWQTAYVGRWEILGADGPSQPAGQTFSTATYGFGSKALNWVRPDGTSGDDPLSDASFVLSLVVPAPTGLTGVELQRPVDDFVPGCAECQDTRCCTVASVSYVHLSWTQTTVPGSGFREYRIYRVDPLGPMTGGPVLIGVISSITTTTFDDYEFTPPADGGTVQYLVTVVDQAGVESAETTVDVVIHGGGVTLSGSGCTGTGSILTFTSNADPSWTVAYPKVVDRGTPVDEFVYPDADEVDLERFYGRDCQVAFRPVEDGCEAFSADLLVYESCDPNPSFAIMHSAVVPLREMSRADVPYVTVRDSDGVRWLASVVVPSSSVYRDRGAVIVRSVQIVETNKTAGPVEL